MSTLQDVEDVHQRVTRTSQFYGFTGEFGQEYFRRYKEILETFCLEAGYSEMELEIELMELPLLLTNLGKESQEKFTELKRWLATQHSDFKGYAE